jgi:RHS repeat-associated protein
MNQDTVSNLYDFPAREYGNIQGRWPATDPAGTASVDPRNPQTWNRYAYALNNPLGFIDPTGTTPGGSQSAGFCFAAPGAAKICPGTTSCSYYDKSCKTQTNFWGKLYECEIAPAVCKSAGNGPVRNCIRLCLQILDATICGQIDSAESMADCEAATHAVCYPACYLCNGD